jgi:hypothetical protein
VIGTKAEIRTIGAESCHCGGKKSWNHWIACWIDILYY